MKIIKLFIAAITVSLPLISGAQSPINFTINGQLNSLSAPANIYIMYYSPTGTQTDSCLVNKGAFTFKGSVDKPTIAYLIVNKPGTGGQLKKETITELYLEQGTINVNSPDSGGQINISGGELNAGNQKLKAFLKPASEIKRIINKDYLKASPQERNAEGFKAAMAKRNTAYRAEVKALTIAFIRDNPNSLISLFALKSYAGQTIDVNEIEPIFNMLSADIKSGSIGLDYLAEINKFKRITIGAQAPDFTQVDTSGKPVSLHNFKGRYVLIDFWASWCSPCRAENPNLVRAFNLYKDKGFTILGVSLDNSKGKERWIKAIHDDQLNWTQVSDLKYWKNEVAQLYAIQSIPQNVLVGPDGKIIAKNLRGDALQEKLAELFSAL